MTLSRCLTLHLSDSSSIALNLKSHSLLKSKFPIFLLENTTIIAQEINKPQLQILAGLYIKTKRNRIYRINFKSSDNVLIIPLFIYFL